MQVAFRTDASLQIGTGHVMRCLTLADALRERGSQSTFICRPHAGHLLDLIQQRGHTVKALAPADDAFTAPAEPTHAQWLGTNWASDAAQTQQALGDQVVDWLVVDHYALERRWEHAMRPHTQSIMAIDDLADRPHECDLLLDQTFGRYTVDYQPLVPAHCQLLCGSQYVLLRPEFASLRPYSLKRRTNPDLRELLITMGGVDKDNATGQVLQVIRCCKLPADCRITVVMGVTAPWLEDVRRQAQNMPWPTRVLVGVSDMAQLMADSDLAIGAAGSTSWELCCLGVPSLLVCTAANQRTVIGALASAKATSRIDWAELIQPDGIPFFSQYAVLTENLATYTKAAALITDGSGASRVCAEFA
jgi:UDP-2,4-diacetamido-2,4,6-trideoxy-beta-L-altropyranose hydrolase